MDVHQQNKNIISSLRKALYDLDPQRLSQQLASVLAADCVIRFCHPVGDLSGPQELYERVYRPLLDALPDLERRDYIVIAGGAENSLAGSYGDQDRLGANTTRSNWVGCAGHYYGVFERPWLDIPPTQQMVAMRFHEFFRLEEGLIVEMQVIWDIPQLMMQTQAWPLCPSLGVEWPAPAPATQDGVHLPPRDPVLSDENKKLVLAMLAGLKNHAQGGVEAMELPRYWHPKMSWYGPAGIGSSRRISGFRLWHQIPFLKAMPDRGGNPDTPVYFFADGAYVGETGWPGMKCTISRPGWLGIAPGPHRILMRSLDFWRCERGLIRENWVLIDLLHVYQQVGIDVFDRMREIAFGRRSCHLDRMHEERFE